MNDEHYTHLRIIDCSEEAMTAAGLGELLRDAGFASGAEQIADDPQKPERVSAGSEWTAYGLDGPDVRNLLDALARHDYTFACQARTEGDQGEPGELFIRLLGRAWHGRCDRSGTPLIDADAAAEIAAEPDPQERATLLDYAAGTRTRAIADELIRIRRLEGIAAEEGVGFEDLGGEVEAVLAAQADNINNGGVRDQLRFLAEGKSDDEFRTWLRVEFH